MNNILTSTLCFLFLSLSVQATTILPEGLGTIINDGEGTITYAILEPGCTYDEELFVYVANLEKFGDALIDENGEEYYMLPWEMPPISFDYLLYTDYDILAFGQHVPITRFYYAGEVNYRKYYKGTIELQIDLSEDCLQTSDEDDLITVHYDLDLVYCIAPNACHPYPVCNFSGWDDIFSCLVFEEVLCDGFFTDDCTNLDLTQGNYARSFKCNNCLSEEDNPSGPVVSDNDLPEVSSHNDNEPGLMENGENTNIITAPNPFEDRLSIQWTSREEINSVQLYHTSGQLMWSKDNLSNEFSVDISTLDFPTGIYFLRVVTDREEKIIKVIKS